MQLIIFKLKEGVTREQYLPTTLPTTQMAIALPGCISDELLYDAEKDRWVDIVWYESIEAARAAEEVFMTADVFPPMFELMDMDSVEMIYLDFVQGYSLVPAA